MFFDEFLSIIQIRVLVFPSSPPQQRRQQQELLKLQQQQALQQAQQPQAKLSGWGGVAKQPVLTKSLLEIQREEAQQMKQRKDHHQQQQQQPPQQQQQQPPPQQHPIVTQQIRTQARTVCDPYDTTSYWLKEDKSYVELQSWVSIFSGFSTKIFNFNVNIQNIV